MGVIVVGAGSIGLLLASFLAEKGINVTMLVRRKEQALLISEKGIVRKNIDGTETVTRVNAETDISKLPLNSLLVLAVKSFNIPKLLQLLEVGKINTPVLFIQNGIGHFELANQSNLPHLAFATVEHGALRTDERTVIHNGVGMLTIGAGRGDASLFDLLEEAHSDSFPVRRHNNAELILMRKVLINCMINPLTAILQVENGELLTNKYSRMLFEELYAELMVAFPEMVSEITLESARMVCMNTAKNRSSMLIDREMGRKMEIDTIVTSVIAKANKNHKALPLLSILEKLLYALQEKGEL